MAPELVVALKGDGVFTSDGPAGRFHLLFDGPDERWLVAGPARGEEAQFVSMHRDLDEALIALVASSGLHGRFRVSLPCGQGFGRPGKVPATEVLGAFGYAVVRSLTGFVVVPAPVGEARVSIGDRLAASLVGRPVEVGALEFIEAIGGTGYWCCDITMPFEGPVLPSRAADVFREALDGSGLEAIDEVELDTPRPVLPNEASVLTLARLVRAA